MCSVRLAHLHPHVYTHLTLPHICIHTYVHTPLTHMCLHLIVLVSSLGEREQINHSFYSKLILNVYYTLTHNYKHITIHEGTILVRIAEEMDLMRQVLSLPSISSAILTRIVPS